MSELGVLVGEHRIDTSRRRRVAVGLLVVGAVASAIGLSWLIYDVTVVEPQIPGGAPVGFDYFPTALVGIGLAGLILGVILAVIALRNRTESFDLHEHGLVRRVNEQATVVGWAEIASVRVYDVAVTEASAAGLKVIGTRRSTWLARLLGGDLICVIKLHDGRSLRFNNFTANARGLADWLLDAVSPR